MVNKSVTENPEGNVQVQKGPLTPPTGSKQPPPGGQVSSETPPTYTKESEEKAVVDAVHQALSKVGRTAEAFELREAAVTAGEKSFAQERQVRREAELQAARDEPEKITDIRAKHAAEDTNVKVAGLEAELKAKEEIDKLREADAVKTTQESSARALAAELTVDPDKLLTLSKLTDGSKEAITAMAQGLPKVDPSKPPVKLDPGVTSGVPRAKTASEKVSASLVKMSKQ